MGISRLDFVYITSSLYHLRLPYYHFGDPNNRMLALVSSALDPLVKVEICGGQNHIEFEIFWWLYDFNSVIL